MFQNKANDSDDEQEGNIFLVTDDFQARFENDLTVSKDDLVFVLDENYCNDPNSKTLDDSRTVFGRRYDPDKRWLVKKCDGDRERGLVPACILQPVFEEMTKDEAFAKRRAVIDELIETETDFINDIRFIVDNYLRPATIKFVPKIIKENFQVLFGNLREILEFHNSVLLEAVQYYANEPNLLGRAFIRLEREFDKHVLYCRNEPVAQQFLNSVSEVSDFFEALRQNISDDKTLADHLKLPIQRINDYQLLFKELIRYTDLLNEPTNDLQRALELMINVPNRVEDDKFLANIEGYRGNLYKFGHLVTHDWFSLKYNGSDTLKERYLFLFKSLILVTKVKRISENRSVFQFKESIKLSDIQFRDRDGNFEFEVIKSDSKDNPIVFVSHREQAKSQWLNEIRKYATEFSETKTSPKTEEQTNMSRQYSYNSSASRSYYTNRASFGEITESSTKHNYSSYSSRAKTLSSTSGDNLIKEVSGVTSSSIIASSSNVSQKRSSSSSIETSRKRLANIEDSIEIMELDDTLTKKNSSDSLIKVDNEAVHNDRPVLKLLKACNVQPGENATFEISVAEKYTKVTWLKDNKKFNDELSKRISENHSEDTRTYELVIHDCNYSDTGIYTAIATNDNNDRSISTAQLIVSNNNTELDDKAPIFLIRLKDTELLEGTHLCFMVKVQGDPLPNITFYKDNALLNENDANIQVIRDNANTGSYELYIETVRYLDAGVYKCVAENSHGSDSCEATVTVTDHKDVFGEIADNDLLLPGEKPSFTWKRDGKEFEPDERFKVLMADDDDSLALIFQHVKPEDAGLYTCVAQTSNGRISCSAELTIQGAVHELHREPEVPKLEQVMAENHVVLGGTALLEVKVSGYPKPEVNWSHDGHAIEPSGKYKFLYDDNESMSLMIKNAETHDSGVYEISASNELGMDKSEIMLNVKSGPRILTDLNDVICVSDESLKINMEIEGTPKPNVKFYKDSQEIITGTDIQILNEDNLYTFVIERVSKFDSGTYSVIAENEISQVSKFWKISVESKPTILEKFQEHYECSIDENVELKCQISAVPKPEVKWFKNGQEISDEHFKISSDGDTYLMRITGAVDTDSAEYKIKAFNIHGSTSIDTKLYVKRPPKLLKNLEDITANEHDKNVELDVKVEAFPKPEIKWYLDEMEITESRKEFTRIESDNGSKLIIKEVTSNLSGHYRCRVTNELGETETSAKLTVNCKPKIVKHLSNTTIEEGSTLNLGIEVTANPEPTVKWLKNGKEISTDARIRIIRDQQRLETYNLIVDLVKYEDGGDYEVIVQNCFGTISSKSTVIVQKLQMCDTIEDTDNNIDIQMDTDRLESPISFDDVKEECQECDEDYVFIERIPLEVTEKDMDSFKGQVNNIVTIDTNDEPKLHISDTNLSNNSPPITSIETDVTDKEHTAEPIILLSNVNDGKVVEKSDIVYKVQVTGSPPPAITWTANNEPLQNDSRITITKVGDEYQLVVKKAQLSDAGIYQCKIANNKGVIVQKAVLTVLPEGDIKKPKIIEPLHDQIIAKGSDLELTVILTSDSTPELKWFLNEEQLTINKSSVKIDFRDLENYIKEFTCTLSLFNCDSLNAGDYKVIAGNKFGECSSECNIKILSKPSIEGVKNISVDFGSNAEIHVDIDSSPPAKVSWVHNNSEIENNDKFVIIDEPPVHKLIIKNVSLDDVGDYAVTASNSEGEKVHTCSLITKCEPPRFVKELSNNTIDDGDSVKLRVRCGGIPLPSIQWVLNNMKLSENSAKYSIKTTPNDDFIISELEFINFRPEDAGKVTCIAINAAGKAEVSCQLSISKISPTFLRRLERTIDTIENQPLELIAKITGSPKPVVKWFKDNLEISNNDRVLLSELPDGIVKLNISHVRPEDSGTYKLLISNQCGDASGISVITVEEIAQKPEFTVNLQDVEAIEGDPLKLEAIIKANPAPEVKWIKDGVPIKNNQNIRTVSLADGTVKLEIDYLKPENVGIYNLVVSNSLGETVQSAKVSMKNKPRKPDFTSDLSPVVKVVEGFPVKLQVTALGHPQPSIYWYHNGKEITPESEHVKIIQSPEGTNTLLINESKLEDIGNYEVVAENSIGRISQNTELKIAPKCNKEETEEAPVFLTGLKDVYLDEGSCLKLEAAIAGNPIPDVAWYQNGNLINSSDILMTCDGRKVCLKLDKAKISHSGSYCCELTNPNGCAKSDCTVNLKKISSVPVFVEKFGDVQQLPKHNAVFSAKVSGYPNPIMQWFKDGHLLSDSSKYYMQNNGSVCQLNIRNCELSDCGVYKCVARNDEGESECIGSLKIVDKIKINPKIEKPSFLKRITDLDLYPGMTAKFTACASGIPEPSIEWFHNNKPLFNSGRFKIESDRGGLLRLSISDINESDLGEYSCRAYNDFGQDVCMAKLIFDSFNKRPKRDSVVDTTKQYRPRIPGAPLPLTEAPYISRMTDRSLTLSWRPLIPYTYREPITYRLEMCELPNDDWKLIWSNIRSCTCGVRDLKPDFDYKFRIRTENKFGISEPSPYVMTHRQKLIPDLVPRRQFLEPGVEFNPKTSYYFPTGFDIERPSLDGMKQAPIFLRQERDRQFGLKNQNSDLFWFVYGYPKPTMSYYFNGDLIESGGRFDYSYTRNGQAKLFINKMLERDVGDYEAIARNEHGEARQTVRLDLAEHPYFIKRPEVQCGLIRGTARFEAKVCGIPYPEIRWYKDWKLLSSTSRIKIEFTEPNTAILIIRDVIQKDEGLYSISARNVAGSISYSVMLYVEENESDYEFRTYTNIKPIRINRKLFTDFYDIGDELGRGTQGITYHVVDKSTGYNYAAKIMHGRDEFKRFMYNEMDAMNNLHNRKLIRLHDIYENDDSFILIMELAGGGQLVRDYLLQRDYYYETEISGYIRQILLGLDYMHSSGYAHLGLNIGDILLSHIGGHDIKISDFGLSRKISQYNTLMDLKFGMPDFVSPEIANGEGVTYSSDMWSLGIITYILLSGQSPFLGANDRDTLTNIREGKWSFDDIYWSHISDNAKDFITKLLVYKSEGRINVKTALSHPWISGVYRQSESDYKISTELVRKYYSDYYRNWYDNASCRTWYRRRNLSSAFEQSTKMVYPPYEVHTPTDFEGNSFIGRRTRTERTKKNIDDSVSEYPPLGYDIGVIKSESHYQNGPDTYLLQLRDVDFPVRLREYMKVAASCGSGKSYIQGDTNGYDWSLPSIRERRRFMDVMDEEIDDERKERIKQYGSDEIYSLRRLRHELGTRLDTYVEAEAMIESRQSGQVPFFREKPQTLVIIEGQDAQMTCLAVGSPTPIVQWFKNDTILVDTNRITINVDETTGRSILKLKPATVYDIGLYKIVARNKIGQTVTRSRVVLGSVPDPSQTPKVAQVSDTEILLTWNQPKDFGYSPVLCYKLQYKQAYRTDWIDLADNIDHEFYLVRNLESGKSYVFRLATKNKIGWSPFGLSTTAVETKPVGCDKVKMSNTMLSLQNLTDSGQEIMLDVIKKPDYSLENNLLEWITDRNNIMENYNFISEISRGEFSTVIKGINQSNSDFIVAKILELKPEVEDEFKALRTLRHEKIVTLLEAYKNDSIAVLIMEKLQGADVLTYLSTRHEYSEQIVANIVIQILDALQYMHWRGYCHLDLQPDNVVMCSVRSAQIKLVDMGAACKVSKLGTVVSKRGHCDFISPEVLIGEQVFPQTDIWSLGVLTYLMLSGTVPFESSDDEERAQNIVYVRYRFENLYKDISQESVRFLMSIFKRNPWKRPTSEECHENRWFQPNDFMIRKREKAVFCGENLKKYSEEYHSQKSQSSHESICKIIAKTLEKSKSVQDELIGL